MSANLELAKTKLAAGVPPFPYEDLPSRDESTLWTDIKATYDLTLPELSALKNARCGQTQSGVGTFVVEMILNGETKRARFKLKPTVTIESVKAEMRSTFNVTNGTLSLNMHDLEIVDELVAGEVYYFIEFTPPPQTGATGAGGSAGTYEVHQRPNRYRHAHVASANISDEEIARRLARDNTSCIAVTVTIFRSQSCVRREIVHTLCRMGFKCGFARRLDSVTVQVVIVLPSGRPEGILELAHYFGEWAVSQEYFKVDRECRDTALLDLLKKPFFLIKSGIPDPENRSNENFDCYSSDDGGYEIRSVGSFDT